MSICRKSYIPKQHFWILSSLTFNIVQVWQSLQKLLCIIWQFPNFHAFDFLLPCSMPHTLTWVTWLRLWTATCSCTINSMLEFLKSNTGIYLGSHYSETWKELFHDDIISFCYSAFTSQKRFHKASGYNSKSHWEIRLHPN